MVEMITIKSAPPYRCHDQVETSEGWLFVKGQTAIEDLAILWYFEAVKFFEDKKVYLAKTSFKHGGYFILTNEV